ncbi:NAD-binding protein [Thiomicrospira aerophila AL3]|uniref:NAD-binding protein n=1 Tax=Thiomicrospira aerophila AL3 TaxID=717772 RepID=W0DR67_9GAMM|nr:NAD(P)-dependent oxidoreductase [Thiomicrospira aerophila]AHF01115.1 NAD-binding protein [Thiomicrospira aerophila AL3]
MNKVLVIGASGSLGKGVIKEIKGQFDITGTYTSRYFEVEGVKTQQLDITDANQFDALDKDFDSVFLVAGAMPAMMKGYTPQHYIDVNTTGVLNVLEYCRKNNIKKLVYIMTFSDVSGSFYTGVPIQDDAPRTLTLTGDHAVYSITKVAACDLIEHYHQEYGLQTIILRIPTVYCNDDNFNYYVDGELKVKAYVQMIRSIVNNHSIQVWGDPSNAKDMPYIKDFAALVSKALLHPTAQGIFNAGTGHPVSLEELVETMIRVFSPSEAVTKEYLPSKPSQPNFTFDMTKTNTIFDFEPSWTLEKSLQDILDTLGMETFKG